METFEKQIQELRATINALDIARALLCRQLDRVLVDQS